MKSILMLFALLSAPNALAGEISCAVNHYYSRMNISWDEREVRVLVENPRGYAAMPQFEAPIAPENIKMMEMQAKDLEDLGSVFIYRWEKSQCEFSQDNSWLMACRGRVKGDQESNAVSAVSFTTAKISETSLSGDHAVLRLRFIFEKGNRLFFTALPFPLSLCRLKD